MTARLFLATLLLLTGAACEKEIHEVRLHRTPQETLDATVESSAADQA